MWRIGALAFGFVFAPLLAVAATAADCAGPADLQDGSLPRQSVGLDATKLCALGAPQQVAARYRLVALDCVIHARS